MVNGFTWEHCEPEPVLGQRLVHRTCPAGNADSLQKSFGAFSGKENAITISKYFHRYK